jgi:hypothetical protein
MHPNFKQPATDSIHETPNPSENSSQPSITEVNETSTLGNLNIKWISSPAIAPYKRYALSNLSPSYTQSSIVS